MTKIDIDYYKKITKDIKEGLEEIEETINLNLDDFIRSRSKRYSMRYAIILIV